MTKEQKVIRAKLGLLELARQLGNVSQACKMMGYSRDSFYRSQGSSTRPEAEPGALRSCRGASRFWPTARRPGLRR